MLAIVDYGVGNLKSISKAIENLGEQIIITNNAKKILTQTAIILPGVGAFKSAMNIIRKKFLDETIKEFVDKGKYLLGICLGMQLLFSESEEGGDGKSTKGLNLIKGSVKRIPAVIRRQKIKLPQLGWNSLTFSKERKQRNHTIMLLDNIPEHSYFYFAHTYYCLPEEKDIVLATTKYGIEFPAVIQKNNICGVQFHPEKSSVNGLKVLENFCKLAKQC